MSNSDQPALQAIGVEKVYRQGHQRVEVLHNLDLSVAPGEQLAIIGSSGCGKSTLLHLLAGLDTPDSGHIELGGQNIFALGAAARGKLRNAKLGFVYQFHHLLPEFSAVENVAMPLLIGRQDTKKAKQSAEQLLTRVGPR